MNQELILVLIDHKAFKVPAGTLTGLEIRNLPQPPIGPEFDLWQDVPGGDDIKIGNSDSVTLKPAISFYTAPTTINPGSLRHALA